jgi:Family of unknown function (DUF6506)
MYREAFLFIAGGADPATDRIVRDSGLYVFVPDADTAARMAAELARDGVELVELYRGFDLATGARVVEAVAGRAPVGVPAYGRGAPAGEARSWAAIFWDPTADPTDWEVTEHEDGSRTTIVRAPDEDATARVAAELVEAGVDAIELCGATPLTTAARVLETVGGRASVGSVTFAFESLEGVAAYKASFEAPRTA